MKTIITLKDSTVIQTACKEVTVIASKVKISSKYGTNARIEKERIEGAIFKSLDRQMEKAQRSVNQRELRRAKR